MDSSSLYLCMYTYTNDGFSSPLLKIATNSVLSIEQCLANMAVCMQYGYLYSTWLLETKEYIGLHTIGAFFATLLLACYSSDTYDDIG